ncbi:helix-turn-helix domain-containing protein [Flavobacterium sp.]|uniref:helix-turn-helix domain-containing protein n=1 Tax=Flavobacterium sp. TaxID=239 RepID=UPI003F695A35
MCFLNKKEVPLVKIIVEMSTAKEILSENLKLIRKQKNISQQFIAERCDMLASTYNRIENMKVSPSIDTIEKIALAIEVPIAELFQSQNISDKSLVQKLEKINNLSEYNQNVVGILLDSIIEKDKLEQDKDQKMKSRLEELDSLRK